MDNLDKKTRSIFSELCDYSPKNDDRDSIAEYRGQQVIASARNLLKFIAERYDVEEADDLSRRLIRAIATGDDEKFNRKIRSIRETKINKIKPKDESNAMDNKI